MKLTRSDISALKKLVDAAKDSYYKKGVPLRLKLSQYSPEVATALKLGKLNRSAQPVLPEEASVTRGMFEVTDAKYDLIEKIIQQYDPKWQPVSGAKVTVAEKKVKTKLPVPLSSLDKAYPGDGKIAKFTAKYKGPWVVSDKLDGNALEIVYKKGQAPKAYTKTSATIGQDVSFLVPHMDIPQKLGIDLVVRAETIMLIDTFAKNHSRTSEAVKKYKNARNMVAGVFNTKGVHKAIADIHVIAHEILGSNLKPSEQLKELKSLGFSTVAHVSVGRLDDSVLESILVKRRKASKYMIDGQVVVQDKPHRLDASGGNPDYAIAFKINDETENLARTKVLSVEWNASKHGAVKPRVMIEPVELAGATVSWATGHNAYFIVHGYSKKDAAKFKGKPDMPIGPGAIIELTRSGEVIPYITKVVKPARKPQLPDVDYEWNATGIDIIIDTTDNDVVAVKRIASFLRQGLGVEKVAEATVAKCYDHGMTKIKQFLTAKAVDFLKLPGVKETSAFTYYNQIQQGCKNADFAAVAAHSGFFGKLFATKRMQMIVDRLDFYDLAQMREAMIVQKVGDIPGFSDKTAIAFAKGLPKFIKWVKTLPLTFKKAEKVKVAGSEMKGQNVCFTGFRNEALEKAIVRQGGTIASGVNAKTTILVVKDKGSSSSKNVKAKELGIPIYTADELVKKHKGLLF